PILSAMAAERAGVDLVFLASHPRVVRAASRRPTIIPVELEGHDTLHEDHLKLLSKHVERVDAIAVGMGLSTSSDAEKALAGLLDLALKLGKKVVLDADALKLLPRVVEYSRLSGAVLTPHDKEFELLFGEKVPEASRLFERARAAFRAAHRLGPGSVILLKGPVDVMASASRVRLNKTGAPVMSVGGTGDVLAGLVAGLIAKGMDTFDAACVAAYVNGAAGALAYRDLGDSATALDVLKRVPLVLKDPIATARHAIVYRRVNVSPQPVSPGAATPSG
ncbi:MAG: NAD(P)H-hydrate dehydratase, partial [Thermoproteota archaeon]